METLQETKTSNARRSQRTINGSTVTDNPISNAHFILDTDNNISELIFQVTLQENQVIQITQGRDYTIITSDGPAVTSGIPDPNKIIQIDVDVDENIQGNPARLETISVNLKESNLGFPNPESLKNCLYLINVVVGDPEEAASDSVSYNDGVGEIAC